jgi:hypothetical protein
LPAILDGREKRLHNILVKPPSQQLFLVLYYLLETQWVKPVPIGVTSGGRVGRRTVDIVQTLVDGKRVDFYLDRESHLPLKVAFVNERDGRSYYWIMFSDYAPVKGIQMPQRTNGMGDADIPTSIQLDVGYDESIFERPPSIEAGAEAWRARR